MNRSLSAAQKNELNQNSQNASGFQFDSTRRLLIVDDDIKFCRLINDYLGRYGFEVSASHNGTKGLERALTEKWDAIILDVMMPGLDGYEVLRRIRSTSQTPVLILSALGEETDKIVGLEIGADDYLPKTFSPRELLARLRAVIRRSQSSTQQSMIEMREGPIAINLLSRTATLNDELLPLTTVEFDLLVVLLQAKGRIKSRESILSEIRDRNFDINDRSIDVHVSALRRKLNDDPKCPRFIRTIRSVGYSFLEQKRDM